MHSRISFIKKFSGPKWQDPRLRNPGLNRSIKSYFVLGIWLVVHFFNAFFASENERQHLISAEKYACKFLIINTALLASTLKIMKSNHSSTCKEHEQSSFYFFSPRGRILIKGFLNSENSSHKYCIRKKLGASCFSSTDLYLGIVDNSHLIQSKKNVPPDSLKRRDQFT